MVKRKLKRLKGKSAARMFAAVVVSSLLLGSSLGVSFASEEADGNVAIGSEPSEEADGNVAIGSEPSAGADEPLTEDVSGDDVSGDEISVMALQLEPAPQEENRITVTDETALRDAVAADTAIADSIVVLGKDFTLTNTLEVTATSDITLDLNGYTLALNLPTGQRGSVIKVTNGITFTLTDSRGGGVIKGGNADAGGGVYCSGNFIMDGGTISRNKAWTGGTDGGGGGVYCKGAFTMERGEISRNEVVYGIGGGVHCRSTFIMTGGKISENTAKRGGGVFCQGSFTMSGEEGEIEISENIASAFEGGGVYCAGSFTMERGTIKGNNASGLGHHRGGGVYCMGNFTMTGGTISGNTSGEDAVDGGIVVAGGGSDIFKQGNGNVLIRTSPTNKWGKVDGTDINGWYYDRGPQDSGTRWSAGNAQIFDKVGTQFATNKLALRAAYGHDHSWEQTTAPTCTEGGEEKCSCSHTRTTDPLGHSYAGTVTKPPTQTEEGIRTYTCGNDPAHTYTEPIPKLTPPEPPAPPHEHSYTQSKAPTCTADGEEKCSCGLTKPLSALGHTYNAGVITKEADCETAGVKTITCSRCNDAKTEELPALGHKWNNGTVTTAAECEAAGVKTLTCSKCNRTKTEALPALGHRWDNGEITKEPTQTEYGVKTYKCLNNETHIKTEPVEKLKDNGAAANQTNTTNTTGTTNTTNTTGTTNPVNKEQTQEGQTAAAASELTETYTAEIIPDAGYEYQAYRNETPDPNDPETPEIIVVIDENGTPLTYRKVEDPDNPGKMIYVEDSSIPLSAPSATENAGHWAVLNLIMTLVSVLGGVYGLIGYVTERRKKEGKRRGWYLLGAAAALLSVIVFVLTGDMRMTMILADRYTFLMAVLALMQTPGFLQRRKEEEIA